MRMLIRLLGFAVVWMAVSVVVNGCVCVVHQYDARRPAPVYVAGPPPPAKAETKPPAPSDNQVWVGGHWDWNQVEEEWEWADGSWQTPPDDGSTWEEPSYEDNEGDWVFTPGYWKLPGVVTDAPVAILPGDHGPVEPVEPGEPEEPEEPAGGDEQEAAGEGAVVQAPGKAIVIEKRPESGEPAGGDDDPYGDEDSAGSSAEPGETTKLKRPEKKTGLPGKRPDRPEKKAEAPGKRPERPEKTEKPPRTEKPAGTAKPESPGKAGRVDPKIETSKKPEIKEQPGGTPRKTRRSAADEKCVKTKDCNCDGVCDPGESKDCADCRR